MASSSLPIEARKELGARERLIEQSGCKDRVIDFSAPVRLYPDADYQPSPGLTDWMGADERRELKELLSCVRDLDDEMQGLSVSAAAVLIQWDFDCLALVELLKQWTVGVLTSRVRRLVRRGDHPADVFFRVHGEYVNVMRPLLTREDSLGRTISYPVAEYAAYLIGNLLKDVAPGSERGNRHDMGQVRNALATRGVTEYPLEGIAAEVSRAVFPPAAPSVGTETPAETLSRLMSEILIMRPFLIEGFDPEQTVQPLPGGQFFAWNFLIWPFLPVVAVVDTDEARLRLFTGNRGLAPDRSVAFNLHGLPSACGLWLSTVSDLKDHGDETMARFARLLGMVHAQCRDLYAKVDFGPILNALDANELEKIDADRSIAIALATPMESAGVSAPAASVPAGSEPAPQVAAPFPSRSLRLRHLLACLVRCGCQVGPGKGSEIKVWRPGGHIFTLGRHRKDPEINSFIVKRVLHRLQIPVEQFIDAAWSRRLGRHTTVAPLVGVP